MSGLNHNAINRFYRGLREHIADACEIQRPMFGVVKVDESLFGPKRVNGKRGRGTYGKTTFFGIFERDGQVYTEVVPNSSKATLQLIIRGKVDVSTVINSDGWCGNNGLVDLGYGNFRIDHSKNAFSKGGVHMTVSKASGALPKLGSANSKESPKQSFIFI